MGQELVQRRVEQSHRQGTPVDGLQDLFEVRFLQRAQAVDRVRALRVGLREDHGRHQRLAVAEEHVLGPAQADAFGAELNRPARVLGRVGVCAHA